MKPSEWHFSLFIFHFLPDFGVYHQVDAKGAACIDQCLCREHQDGFRYFADGRLKEAEIAQHRASNKHEKSGKDSPIIGPTPMPLPMRAGSRYSAAIGPTPMPLPVRAGRRYSAINVFLVIHIHWLVPLTE